MPRLSLLPVAILALMLVLEPVFGSTVGVSPTPPVLLPGSIEIVLAGSGWSELTSTQLSPASLVELLDTVAPTVAPHVLSHDPESAGSARQAYVGYALSYSVRTTDDATNAGLVNAIAAAASPKGDGTSAHRVVDAKRVEAWLADAPALAGPAPFGRVVLLAPDVPTPGAGPDAGGGYAYVYDVDESGTTESDGWVGQGRSTVFVDVQARVTEFGHIDRGRSAVLRHTFPHAGLGTVSAGPVAAVVVSAIEYVFAPDVMARSLVGFGPSVAVELRGYYEVGHEAVLGGVSDGSAAQPELELELQLELVERVQADMDKLRLPWQTVTVTAEHVAVAAARDVALAAQAGLVTVSSMERTRRGGTYDVVVRPYMDADVLAARLCRNVSAGAVQVHVLSLDSLPRGLTFQDGALVAAEPRCVLVLDPPVEHRTPSVPFFDSDGARVRVWSGAGAVGRRVSAGLALLGGGIAAPLVSWSASHGRLLTSYAWAMGAHPYGVFGRYARVGGSPVFWARQGFLRVLDAAIEEYLAVVDAAEAFARDMMFEAGSHPLDIIESEEATGLHGRAGPGKRLFIDRLYHYRHSEGIVASSRARTTVQMLHDGLARAESQLRDLVDSAWALDADTERARSVLASIIVLRATGSAAIGSAVADLECCSFVHETDVSSWDAIRPLLPILSGVVIMMAFFAVNPAARARSRL